MKLDLHLHTTRSDGSVAPEAVPALARRAGLAAIAITDHDTTSGVEAARGAAAAGGGPLVIAGMELSCSLRGADLHLLGYGVDPAHPALGGVTGRMAVLRRERMMAIVERLNALGVRIAVEDVTVPDGCASVGRPHIAAALVRRGAARTVNEAFQRWLGDGQSAWIPARGPEVEEGIGAVRAAGGLSVWAHPALEDSEHFAGLAELGLDGVEALRPSLAPEASQSLEQSALEAGLLVTGGSDWHGAPGMLGSWYVTERHVKGLLERLGLEC
jgi:predicted metal-dependent phosphoesterase TrpH